MSTCRVDCTYFPFDVQTCGLTFVTWSYTSSGITFDIPQLPPAIDLRNFQNNTSWDLVNTYHEITLEEKPFMTFYLVLQRKPSHVIGTIILPLVILCILNVSVFVLPSGCGEKVSYSITVFLSFVVFASVIQATMPDSAETSDSLLSIYLKFQIIQSAIISIIALYCVRITNFTKPVPKWLTDICCSCKRIGQIRPCKNKNDVTVLKASYGKKQEVPVEPQDKTNRKGSFLGLILTTVDDVKQSQKAVSETGCERKGTNPQYDSVCETRPLTWTDVTDTIDFILFSIFLVVNLVVTTVFILMTCAAATY